MNNNRNEMMDWLLSLRNAVEGDFASLALRGGDGRLYRWTYTSGSVSGRCEAMSFRIGQGIGGQTLRIGRMVIWNPDTPETVRLRRECPLMQAEGLYSAVTTPIEIHGQFQGVLAVGARKERTFSQFEADRMKSASEWLSRCGLTVN
ncbi:GAF domain-containing protein [Paenibacillus filicis]|uniref:GAF domain-containing protein n=1 Tax=Paenibacillus gyeongsangnamensis TaxID=3388067 RepID=A0ABT4QEF2_9BACL|nr:GAF domain-containing protein [Paenibacillus filicis]MCZ8515261.1 GAF domain-containing protein [Paenibacillus filicis]